MANLPWLDEVLSRLAKRGLPSSYIQRFADELSDHLEDFEDDAMSTDADAYSRLGKPEQVADAAVVAYRRRSFLGRHPTAAFLVFGLSPLVSLICLFILVCVGLRLIGVTAERIGLVSNEGFSTVPAGPIELAAGRYLFSLLTIIIPAILASIIYCKLAKRWYVGNAWILTSCVVLATAAMLPAWDVNTKMIDANGHYAVCAGLWIPGWCGWVLPISVPQLLQFLVPLAIGWWFMRCKGDEVCLHMAS